MFSHLVETRNKKSVSLFLKKETSWPTGELYSTAFPSFKCLLSYFGELSGGGVLQGFAVTGFQSSFGSCKMADFSIFKKIAKALGEEGGRTMEHDETDRINGGAERFVSKESFGGNRMFGESLAASCRCPRVCALITSSQRRMARSRNKRISFKKNKKRPWSRP